jgi:hypothetical protein
MSKSAAFCIRLVRGGDAASFKVADVPLITEGDAAFHGKY